MQSDSKAQQPDQKLTEISLALAALRDSWVKLSLILGDILTELESPQREATLEDVERYLTRLRETDR